jgi:hypothetical protein
VPTYLKRHELEKCQSLWVLQMLQMLTPDVVRMHNVTMPPVADQIHLSEGSCILQKDRQHKIVQKALGLSSKSLELTKKKFRA